MFTGLIEAVGRIVRCEPVPAGRRLLVDPGAWPHRPRRGDSIAISGCCLTVAEEPAPGGPLAFDVIPETLAKTVLGGFAPGDRVNLEHAATLASFLDGHVVQGHVDGVASVALVSTAAEWRVRLTPPAALMEYIIPKGSIAIDGVSLTVAGLSPQEGWFEVALIPTTLEKTTLGDLRAGSRCNIECDAMSKTVVHWLRHYAGGRGGA